MERFPIIVLVIGLLVSLLTIRYPKYRRLTLIGSGALPCVLYIITPELWMFELMVFVAVYASEFWRIRKG